MQMSMYMDMCYMYVKCMHVCACHSICKWICVYMYLCYICTCVVYMKCYIPHPFFRDVRHLNNYQLSTHGYTHAITCMWRRWRTTFRSWFSSPVIGLNSGPQGFIAEPLLTSCRDFKDWSIRSGGKRLSSLTTQSWVLVFPPSSLFQISLTPMCFSIKFSFPPCRFF